MMNGYGIMNGYGMIGFANMSGPFMWIFMVLIWGFAVYGLVCAVRWVFMHSRHDDGKMNGHS